MIELSCPGCKHHLRIANKFAGSRGKCKYCGEHFDVPLEISTTPSDLDSSMPGSGRHFDFDTSNKFEQNDSDGFSFEDLMDKKRPIGSTPKGDDPPHVVDSMAFDRPPKISDPVAELIDDNLGCVFWGTAFFIPPAGLVWAFLTPADHSQRGKGIAASAIMLIVAIGTFVASYQIASRSDGFFNGIGTTLETSLLDATGDAMSDLNSPPAETTMIHGVKVPLLMGLDLQPSSPVPLTEGPFATVAASELSFYMGAVQTDYMELASDYEVAMRESGWDYEFVAGFQGSIGMFTDLYGTYNGKDVYLRIFENDAGVFVVFATRAD
jgi:hypothetical protein